jgi:hypothetical protein
MGINLWDVVCDDHCTGDSGVYCGDNDAHFGRSIVFYHEASGGQVRAPRGAL